MDRAQLQRKTVDEDPEVLPGSQVYLDSRGNVWHDLKFVHTSLAGLGLNREWKHYRSDLKRMWRRAEVQESHFYICTAPATHVTNICSSFALVMALWIHVACSRTDRVVRACAAWVRTMCSRAADTHMATQPGALALTQSCRLLTLGQCNLNIRGGRWVSGWPALVNSLNPHTRKAWAQEWTAMCRGGFLATNWDRDEHDLADIVHFLLFYRKVRASCNKQDGIGSQQALDALREVVVGHLAEALSNYLVKVYLPLRQRGAEKPAPALISPKKSTRSYIRAQPEAIWDLFAQARDSGASVEQIVVVRGHDAHMGCHETRGAAWLAKKVEMYRARRFLAFDRVRHLNIVADPSTHNKKDTMASIVFSWEVQVAAHGDLQYLPQAKTVLNSEQDLPDHIALLAARGRLDRVATFRQLQALSNVVRSLGHWQGLDDFRLPGDWSVRPVRENEVRVVREGASFNRALLFDKATRQTRPVVPRAALESPSAVLAATQDINLLALGLDQGSICAAGYAFSDAEGALIHCKWDKFHRIIRDINLNVEHECHGLFLKTRLFTSYLWGINQKPFGTGLFATEKNTY